MTSFGIFHPGNVIIINEAKGTSFSLKVNQSFGYDNNNVSVV